MYIHVYIACIDSNYSSNIFQKGNVLLCVLSDLNSKKENIINDKNMAENIDGTNLYYFFCMDRNIINVYIISKL